MVDFYRRNGAQATALSLDQLPGLQTTIPAPEEVVTQNETFVRLRQSIARLPARQQEVIALKFFGQLRNQAIADILGLEERTVASYLCRGLRELQQRFNTGPHPNDELSIEDEHPD